MRKKYIKVVKSENWHFEKHSIGKKKEKMKECFSSCEIL